MNIEQGKLHYKIARNQSLLVWKLFQTSNSVVFFISILIAFVNLSFSDNKNIKIKIALLKNNKKRFQFACIQLTENLELLCIKKNNFLNF